MKYEYAVFDVDGVMCKEDKNLSPHSIQAIHMLENKGINVFYASGKHPWYTTGGLRFSGLLKESTIVVGENGGHILFPKERRSHLYPDHREDVEHIREAFHTEYPALIYDGSVLWEEPKTTIFTLFPKNANVIPSLEGWLKEMIEKEGLHLYTIPHKDAVDVIPKGLSKAYALRYLEKKNYIKVKKTVAFGDGMNDYEMLKEVEFPVTVSNAHTEIKSLVKKRRGFIAEQSYGKGVLEAVENLIGE
ncbi:MAG: HAD family hydrolase [Euryarchaeota archaeon]|nr:HAD family hydrolase [Euryarchaeota archaeon]